MQLANDNKVKVYAAVLLLVAASFTCTLADEQRSYCSTNAEGKEAFVPCSFAPESVQTRVDAKPIFSPEKESSKAVIATPAVDPRAVRLPGAGVRPD